MTTPEYVETPRWGNVKITAAFKDVMSAAMAGFTEPTGRSDVKGKCVEAIGDEHGHGWCKFEWCIIQEEQ